MTFSSLQAQDLLGMDPRVRQALLGVSAHGVLLPPNGKLHLVDAGGPDTLIQTAVDNANAGDVILIGPGDYAETVSISQSNITLIGAGSRGAVAIAPTGANDVAVTIDGTSAAVEEVTLVNIGCEGDGTGGGLLLQGDVSRVRVIGSKLEGGAFAAKLESTAAGAIADTRFDDCEFAWTTTALHLTASGGGDPVTQTYVRGSLFHNYTADGVLADVSHTADLWVEGNVFANQEDATEPTQYLDIDVASTTGFVSNNVFATTVFSTAKFGIAAGVIFANNISQAENPSANVGGTSGRPD